MASNRRKYYQRTRKSRMRNRKRSKAGVLSVIFSLAAILFFVLCIGKSFLDGGEADLSIGIYGLIGLVLAAGGMMLGIFGMREQEVRTIAPKAGVTMGTLMTIALAGLYIAGCSGLV